MSPHDAINAVFEGGGAIFLCLNVRRLLKDKSVKGVSLLTTSWWTAWGFWNVYFYSAVNTPASFYAGIAVVLVNAVWLGLAVHYARAEKKVHWVTVSIAAADVMPAETLTRFGQEQAKRTRCQQRGYHNTRTTGAGDLCWDCGAEL
jgi:hypothetical protein